MAKITSYLGSLKFDPSLLNSFQAKYISQIRLVILIVLSIIMIGTFAYLQIPRRLNPEIKIPIVVVNTILIGASPEDIERLITIPIEDKISQLADIDTLTSSSNDSSSTITIQFRSGTDADKARSDVASVVDQVTNLPDAAKKPTVIKLNFENAPIWTFALITDADEASLEQFSQTLDQKLTDLTKVDKVEKSGTIKQEVEIIINPQKMAEYNLSPLELSNQIQKLSTAYPAGNLKTNNLSFAISIDREIKSLDDIRNITLQINNSPVHLGDIATVSYRTKSDFNKTYYSDNTTPPKRVVEFFVYKTTSANIDAAEKDAKALVESEIANNPLFKVITIQNSAEEIVTQFSNLTRDFSTTIILVFILLFLFLGLRQAIISSITVPLTFLSTFAIINALGLTLNFLTSFALLIALGLLIDDTIVTVAAMTRYYATNKFTPLQTGILVWKDFIVPLWSTTIATIWAFLPLLLASGIIGEFIKPIPIVVTATMVSSTSIAVFVTLPLMIVFLKPQIPNRVKFLINSLIIIALMILIALITGSGPNLLLAELLFILTLIYFFRVRKLLFTKITKLFKKSNFIKSILTNLSKYSQSGILDIEIISKRYMKIIDQILVSHHGKRNVLIALIVFGLVGFLLVPAGLVTNEFFPKQDENILYLNVELPSGTNPTSVDTAAKDISNKIQNLPEVSFWITDTGSTFSQNGPSPASNSFQVTLHLTDKEKRQISSDKIATVLRDRFKNYTEGTLSVVEVSGGPPAGSDINIKLLGPDLNIVDSYAQKIVDYLKNQNGVNNISKSLKSGTGKVIFTPDKQKIIDAGLSIDQISLQLRTFANGFTLSSLKLSDSKDDQDVVLRFSSETQKLENLQQLLINSPRYGNIPLTALGTLSLINNPTIITREDQNRSISVSAGVDKGVSAAAKNADLEKFAATLNLPAGYIWKTGGANEENQKSVNSILEAMIISFLLILITMVVEFRSFRQALIAMLIIPLSVAGVLYIFALSATPLSFPALIGILALFGIVVTHAIVVIEKINDNLHHGMELKDSIVDAAGNRLEPVLLTSLATIVGLIPITISDPLWRGLGGAIIAGLIFSGAIKLFFVPVTYFLMFSKKR